MADSDAHSSANSSQPPYFPFDGNCDCSRGGDITLTFNNGSTLKTHSALLKMASPVFDSMLTDCAETKSVSLEGTSHDIWVQILNSLHPAGPSFFPGFDVFRDVERLAELLDQARKFKLKSLIEFMDEVISMKIPKELYGDKVYEKWDTFIEVQNIRNGFARLYGIVLHFEPELPKSSEGVRVHTVKFLESAPKVRSFRTHYHKSLESRPLQSSHLSLNKEIVEGMLKNASLEFYRKLMEELLEKCFF